MGIRGGPPRYDDPHVKGLEDGALQLPPDEPDEAVPNTEKILSGWGSPHSGQCISRSLSLKPRRFSNLWPHLRQRYS